MPSTVCLERVDGLHRRVAQVESRLQFSRNHIRRAGARVQIRHLEGGGLEVFVPLVPFTAGQFGQRRRERMDRVHGQVRIGDMALGAVHRESPRQRAAASDLDGVPERGVAGRLPDDAPVDPIAAPQQGFDDPLGAVHAGPFFVARDQKGNGAAMFGMRRHELLGRGHHGSQTALHIRRATSVKHSVAHGGLKGLGAPFFERSGRHDIGVPGKAQHRPGRATACPEILDIAVVELLDPEPGGLEAANHEVLAALISGRDRGPAHQIHGQFKCSRHVFVREKTSGFRGVVIRMTSDRTHNALASVSPG